jgi:hypothetical protein
MPGAALAQPAADRRPALARGAAWRRLAVATPVAVWYGLLYLLVSLASCWPIVLGYVPLPVEIAVNHPVWGTIRSGIVVRQYGVMEDPILQFYPWYRLLGEAVRAGTLPLWNPYALSGHPLQASMQPAFFHPFTLLGFVLPIDLGWSLGFVLRPTLAALGTALYARALGLPHAAALGAGFVYGWCGPMVTWAGWPQMNVMLALPWVMLGVLRVVERPTPARIGLAAVAFALAPLAGHPEMAAYVVLMGAVYALLGLVWLRGQPPSVGRWRARLGAVAALATVAGLAGLVAAIQVLPTAEWLPQLDRRLTGWSEPMPTFYGFGLVVRHIAGYPKNVIGAYVPQGAIYAGLVTLLLVPAALLHPRRREVWLFVVVLTSTLQFALGWGPVYWLHQASPVPIDFPRARVIVLGDFSLAMLAGFGMAALISAGRRIPRWLLAAMAIVTAVVGALLVWLPDGGPATDPTLDPFTWPRTIFQGKAFALAILGAAVLALAVPPLRRRARPVGTVLCTLVALDMLTFGYGHVPFSRTDTLLETPTPIRFLQEHLDATSRFMASRRVIPYNWEPLWGLATPAGYDYLTTVAIDVVTALAPGRDIGIVELWADRMAQSRSRLIDFLAVRYIMTKTADDSGEQLAARPDRFTKVFDDGSVQIFENPTALPRTQLVPCAGMRVVEFRRRAVVQLNNSTFDPASTVILDDKVPCPEVAGPAGPPVAVTEATFNTYAVQADVTVPSLLVYSDTYYDGWRAYVDGAEVPILRANHAFKAVRVDPGQHQVRFVFDPMSFKVGAALSAVGLAIVIGLLGWSAARRRPGRRRQRAADPP